MRIGKRLATFLRDEGHALGNKSIKRSTVKVCNASRLEFWVHQKCWSNLVGVGLGNVFFFIFFRC